MLGGFIAADLGIFALLAHLAGFPAAVGIKDIILYWSFVFASLALYLRDEKTPKKAAGKGAVLAVNFRKCTDGNIYFCGSAGGEPPDNGPVALNDPDYPEPVSENIHMAANNIVVIK